MKRTDIKNAALRVALGPAAWWIQRTVRRWAPRGLVVGDCRFERLPLYFSGDLLGRARVVPVDMIPLPPLTRTAVRLFSDAVGSRLPFNPAGITYGHMYFVAPELIEEESLHFHELVHVIQWETMGIERFLLAYARGYLKRGYRDSPLEEMAYRHEARFKAGAAPYDVEAEVRREIAELLRP